jgi:hypothetical protein
VNYKDAGGYLVVVLIVFCIFGLVIFGYNVRAQTITATGATGSTVDEGSKDITGTTAIEMPVTIYGCAHIPSTPSFFGEVCKVYDPQTQKRWIVVLGDRGMALAPN